MLTRFKKALSGIKPETAIIIVLTLAAVGAVASMIVKGGG